MSESSEYSSLMELVDSHLSKTSINSESPLKIPSLRGGPNSSSSEGQIMPSFGLRLTISPFSTCTSPITSILSEQVANTLKAKEKKKREDEEMLKEMQNLSLENENDYVIDLMSALQTSYSPAKKMDQDEIISKSSSFESLFELKLQNLDKKKPNTKCPKLLLPCITDLSYILNEKVKKGKPSTFGRVLTAQFKPRAVPNPRKKYVQNTIKPFDFSIPSPCDIYKQNLRKPTMSCTYTAIIK